jgi:hypothetical protein
MPAQHVAAGAPAGGVGSVSSVPLGLGHDRFVLAGEPLAIKDNLAEVDA